MPWPMVHFEIARRLYGDPSPEFLLGSLAPDSIHVRTNDRVEKNKSHLMKPNGDFATNDDLKEFLKTQRIYDSLYLDFILGYVAHIYADRVWTFTVYREFEKQSADKNVYNIDVSKIEFLLSRSTEWFEEIIQKLNKSACYDVGGLTRQEILTYKDEKIDYLSDPLNEPMNVPRIISLEMVERFIDDVAQELNLMFENVSLGAKE
ncbi:zinc dependent phospholipase C family protein [Paenibacillus sp. WQ 127069]|uniref:Zinc dependent phospholipase C family protein n=1 Tax=Paenibacillus baimaensis TaxID=2982185 RepID=A0ABT2UJZ0_9BACL|nr:zinc dependent phospholipase C family protein [Paenibacillus sp. WQ 127069]MCU6794932.1 zinc dependent phospholipase C family protein [Paenibacillus sp. WQ 127069]